jgi:protein-disulfide isomerase
VSKGKKDRAQAKKIVQQQMAQERRRTVTLWTTVSVVVVLVVAGFVGWGVVASQDKKTSANLTMPAGAVDDNTAFARGTGPVTIDIYEDFMCPACNQFEQASGETLTQLVDAKKVKIQYHPISILDRFSNGTEYSTRSAGAGAAAAVAGKFYEYHQVLYANQPEENSDGLDNAKLIELAKQAGITDQAFADAVTNKTYTAWATDATEKATKKGVNGTPTVMVNGKKLDSPSPQSLTAAVTEAGA